VYVYIHTVSFDSEGARNRSPPRSDPVPERDPSLDDLDPLKSDFDRDIFNNTDRDR
jgi:hypothetical protein